MFQSSGTVQYTMTSLYRLIPLATDHIVYNGRRISLPLDLHIIE